MDGVWTAHRAVSGTSLWKPLHHDERPGFEDVGPVGRHIQPAIPIGNLSGGLIYGVGMFLLGF